MSIWVVRGWKFGEYENRFINESKVYLTRDGFKTDLNIINKSSEFSNYLHIGNPNISFFKHVYKKHTNFAKSWNN